MSQRNEFVEGATQYPIGYIEGIYVSPDYRYDHVGSELVKQGEIWCLESGCAEIASDAEIFNYGSHIFHSKLGFKEINRIVCFAKKLNLIDPN